MLSRLHVKTSPHRSRPRGPGASGAGPCLEYERALRRPRPAFACCRPHHLGRNGDPAGSEPCQPATIAASLPRRAGTEPSSPPSLGRSAAGSDDLGRREGVFGALGRTGPHRRPAGGLTLASGVSRKAGPEKRRAVRGISPAGTTRMAEAGSPDSAPEKRPGGPGGMEKNSPKRSQAC